MDETTHKELRPAQPKSPDERAKLLRKLRWIGLDDEANKLQSEMNALAPEERGTVSAGPFSTD
jgi:hypothetical protein